MIKRLMSDIKTYISCKYFFCKTNEFLAYVMRKYNENLNDILNDSSPFEEIVIIYNLFRKFINCKRKRKITCTHILRLT